MSLSELASYLEQTTQKHPIISLIYLERCVDKAKTHGPCYSSRQEAEQLLRELKRKVEQGHKDSIILQEVVSKVEPVITKLGN